MEKPWPAASVPDDSGAGAKLGGGAAVDAVDPCSLGNATVTEEDGGDWGTCCAGASTVAVETGASLCERGGGLVGAAVVCLGASLTGRLAVGCGAACA